MRLSTNVVMYIMILNAMTAGADAAGVWQDWGVEVDVGISEKIEETKSAFDTITSGGLGAQTLIGIYLTVVNIAQLFFQLVTAFPAVVKNILPAGIGFIADIFTGVAYVIFGVDTVAAYSGREF